MARIDLLVPFAQKDEARRCGARWDPQRRTWYAPDRAPIARLKRWMPQEPELNIRSQWFFLASSLCHCWRCKREACVYGIMLPDGHEKREVDEGGQHWLGWVMQDTIMLPHYITRLPESVLCHIREWTRNYEMDCGINSGRRYYMNHCDSCGARLGDFHLYRTPGGAFFPESDIAAARICLKEIAEPFSCSGEYGYDGHMNALFEQLAHV